MRTMLREVGVQAGLSAVMVEAGVSGSGATAASMVDRPGFWRDRPTFVTGGTGFLGSCLARKLAELGARVVCLVRDWVPESELVRSRTIERVTVVRGDVRDANIERVLAEYEIDTVFHLAAQAIVGIANRNPAETFATNIGGTWNVLEACRRASTVKEVVVASSDKAYGEQPNLPYHEGMSLSGSHPYDVSKSCADLLAQSYARSYGLPVAITRCGNLFGGGDLNFNRLVPGTIRHVLRGERPLIRSDGQYVRDYLYVEDAALGYLLLAEQLASRRDLGGHGFNFSSEVRWSALDLTRTLLKMMDSQLEPIILNEAVNEVREAYLSAQKAQHVLGWRPAFSRDEALARTIEWYRQFLSSKQPRS